MQSSYKINPKILMVGMPDMVNICLHKLLGCNFNIIGLIPPHNSNVSRNSIIQLCKTNNIPVYEFINSLNEKEFVEKIKSLNADIGIICSFDLKLGKDFLDTTKDGFINCHPSMLPSYRGANPYFHVINNGEKSTGVTLHFADTNFDTGNIIMQKSIPLEKKETMGTLFNRTNFIIADMLASVLTKYSKQGRIQSCPQPAGDYKKAPKVQNDIKINFNNDALQIERLIRASNPFYNCYAIFRDTLFRIITADYKIKLHHNASGKITFVNKDILEISALNGYIYPKVIQIGCWGIYDIKEFIEKFKPTEGEILK